MLTAGMLRYNAAGRVMVSAAAPQQFGDGATPLRNDGALCLANVNPGFYFGGIGLSASGALSATNVGPVAGYMRGIPFNAAGRMIIAATEPIAFYLAGTPRAANGAICVGV